MRAAKMLHGKTTTDLLWNELHADARYSGDVQRFWGWTDAQLGQEILKLKMAYSL